MSMARWIRLALLASTQVAACAHARLASSLPPETGCQTVFLFGAGWAGCAPQSSLSAEARCRAASSVDTAGWQTLALVPDFVITVPATLHTDTSGYSKFLEPGGGRWVDSQVEVYWMTATGAPDIGAYLLAHADLRAPPGCELPSAPGWVVGSGVMFNGRGFYKATVWLMRQDGPHDVVYDLDIWARSDRAFPEVLSMLRSLRLRPAGGATALPPN